MLHTSSRFPADASQFLKHKEENAMFDLMNLGSVLPYVPTPEIHIDDLRIDIEPSDHSIFPDVHVDASLDIRLR